MRKSSLSHSSPWPGSSGWDGGAVSVHRGALLYSLPIAANYTMFGHHFGTDAMSSDYFLTPTSEWRYALDVE